MPVKGNKVKYPGALLSTKVENIKIRFFISRRHPKISLMEPFNKKWDVKNFGNRQIFNTPPRRVINTFELQKKIYN